MALSESEQRALAALDEQGLIETLRTLVRHRSLTGHEAGAQRWLSEQMRQMGLQVDLWTIDVAALRHLPAFPGMEVEREGHTALGLVAGWRGGEGRCLIFNGHLDVVPEGDPAGWSHDPWAADLEDGYIYGRGSCDMKGGLIAALYALKALKDSGVPVAGSIQLQSVIGEEDGGLGTFATLQRGHRGDAAIVCEPTGLDLVPANAGALTFTVRVPGRSAHACVRLQGVSAIEKYLEIHRALLQLEHERNSNVAHPLLGKLDLPYALSIGRVQAGNWSSSVPETLVFEGRIGVAMGESSQQVREQFERTLGALAEADPWLRDHPLEIVWSGGQFESSEIAPDHPLVALCGQCIQQVCGRVPLVKGEPYGSDLRLLINGAGIPALLLGPGDIACAHMPDERLSVAELLQAARIYILLALRYLQASA
jgi:acetylornithine deacetylase